METKEKKKREKLEFCADFETSKKIFFTDEAEKTVDREKSFAFVCAWGIAPRAAQSEDEVVIGRRIVEFFDYLKKLGSCTVFFHNLKYDGHFILWYALSKGFEVSDEVIDTSFYSFSVKIGKSKITFRDSLKIYPYKLEYLGKLFGVKKLIGDWDYNRYILPSDYLSENELAYLRHDVYILCLAIADLRKRGYTKNTIASIAYDERFKLTFPKHKNIPSLRPKSIKPLEQKEQLELMQAYFGGFCYLNPLYAEKVLFRVTSFDENSMYPDKLRASVLPYGEYKRFDYSEAVDRLAQQLYPCRVYRCRVSARLKSVENLPILMFPCGNQSIRYQGKVIECHNEVCYLSNLDLKMAKNEYDFDLLEIEAIFCWRGRSGFYKNFVDEYGGKKEEISRELNEAKSRGDAEAVGRLEIERFNTKRILNTSYGKDGTKILREKRKFYKLDNLVANHFDFELQKSQFYLPHAIFICAYARYDLYQMIKRAGKDFIYCDTDSVKCFEEKAKEIERDFAELLDNNRIGAWKNEGTYEEAKFLRQKTYYTIEEGEFSVTGCGITPDCKKLITKENFTNDLQITKEDIKNWNTAHPTEKPLESKLRFVTVKGGVALVPTDFEIKTPETDKSKFIIQLNNKTIFEYFEERKKEK